MLSIERKNARILAGVVARRVVFTDVELSHSVARKDGTISARCNRTANLGRGFPYDLRKVRGHWSRGVVLRDLVGPAENAVGNGVVTGSCRQVLF